ncbi:helix-turn-helix domain-containing protein [Paraburkholderia nemoris]|uniref:helix-turn-helix domain-containing protein n=1 Tax=Paraburkholderia nemoris TaxID=2793076 RepID=UPI0038B7193A
MSWAIDQQIVRDAPARHVLLCLANYADKHGGTAFPSASTLSADTGLSERTIRTKLDLLERLGLIAKGNQRVVAAYIDRADRRPVCYDLRMLRPESLAPRDLERGVRDDATGCSSRSDGVQMAQDRGARAAANPSSKPSTEPPENRTAAPPAAKPPAARASRLPKEWVLPRAWGDWALSETARLAGEHVGWAGGAWTPEHVRFEAEKFRDHWHGKSGRGAAKDDWLATWRNWVHNAGPMRGPGKKGGGAWWLSPAAALAMANEVGVGAALPGELNDTWHARIHAAIDNGGKPPAPRPHVSPMSAKTPDAAKQRSAMPEEARQMLLATAKRCSVPKHLTGELS